MPSARPRSSSLKGQNSVMTTSVRTADKPYKWKIGTAPLAGSRTKKDAAA
jgi:hypothetical protein